MLSLITIIFWVIPILLDLDFMQVFARTDETRGIDISIWLFLSIIPLINIFLLFNVYTKIEEYEEDMRKYSFFKFLYKNFKL